MVKERNGDIYLERDLSLEGCECTGSELKNGGWSLEIFMEDKYLKR